MHRAYTVLRVLPQFVLTSTPLLYRFFLLILYVLSSPHCACYLRLSTSFAIQEAVFFPAGFPLKGRTHRLLIFFLRRALLFYACEDALNIILRRRQVNPMSTGMRPLRTWVLLSGGPQEIATLRLAISRGRLDWPKT